jgi:peptidoglycan/xylan/chitin deacetylase (PgdA/CDA1 family)
MKHSVKSLGMQAAAAILRPALLSRLNVGKVSVLMYHGVVEQPQEIPDPCMVQFESFREQMKFLLDHYEVLPLDEALTRCRDNRVRRPVIAITFDDGYQSNHDLVLPVLEELGLPATIYLATEFLDTDSTIWTGLLHHGFTVTRIGRLDWRGRQWVLDTPQDRARALQRIKAQLKSEPQLNLFTAVSELMKALTGSERATIDGSSPYRMLDTASVRRLASSRSIQLGAHTHRHYVLSRISRDQQRSEILTSKCIVESLTSLPCRSFAYPNGRPEDFNQDTLDILGECDFEFAITTVSGPCTSKSFDRLRVPRVDVNGQASLARFKLGLFGIPGPFKALQ